MVSRVHLCRFDPSSPESRESFLLLGLVLGLAIYNRVLLDAPFPLALYNALLGRAPTLRDLDGMAPTVARSLRLLLQVGVGAEGSERFPRVEDTTTHQ